MVKGLLLTPLLFLALLGTARPMATPQQLLGAINSERNRIAADLKVTDKAFFLTLDSLTAYATDRKFSTSTEVQNLQGIHNFLTAIEDKTHFKDGKLIEYLRFGFSIIDWRKDGTLYDHLLNYSRYAIKCASFFADDSAGTQLITHVVQNDPDLVLSAASQLGTAPHYKLLIENAVIRDPDFAKRYFFGYNIVAEYTEYSKNPMVRGIYKIYDAYSTKSSAYVLYDAVFKNKMTPRQADSIAKSSKLMIQELVKILMEENPLGLSSVQRELEYRSIELIRQSALWSPTYITNMYGGFNTNEKLAILAFGYQECNSKMLEQYLELLKASNLKTISPTLIDNLKEETLPPFLKALDRDDRLGTFLRAFTTKDKSTLQQLLATNAAPVDDVPKLRMVALPTASIAPSRADISSRVEEAPPIKLAVEEIEPDPSAGMVIEPIKIELSDSSRALLALKKNIFSALQDIPSYLHKCYAKDALIYAAMTEPDELLKKIEFYKSKVWCREVLEAATLNAPINTRRYLANPTHPVSVVLGFSNDTVIKKFLTLSRDAEYQSRPFLLLDEMSKDKMTLPDATAISRDPQLLFSNMMKIVAKKKYIGKYNVEAEMNYYALKYIRAINDKVGQPEAERFESVDNLSCEEIYYLMVYGREEVFSETFTGLFTRFQDKCLTNASWSVAKFSSFPYYRSFMALCATYGKLDKFLSLFPTEAQHELLHTFALGLNGADCTLSDAATVAETVANTTTPSSLQIIQSAIKQQYLHLDSVHDYHGMAIYGILASMCRDKAVTDKRWFSIIAKKYKIGALTTLANSSINDQPVFVERVYFYNDEDGRDSYQNFVKTYTNNANWKIDQYYSYIRVSSLSTNKIEIYANKPELEESGDKEIAKIITQSNYLVRCVVHRGHSFHTEATLNRVPASARFIFVGSCGGFYKINIALRKAPDAHIVSTRQVGVKQLNDPIMYAFNEYVRQGRDINWRIFWEEMRQRLGSNSLFYDYVPPHKNLESLFLRVYYQIMGATA